MKGVVYQGERLMPGSEALRLYEAGDHKNLKLHLARLTREAQTRGELL